MSTCGCGVPDCMYIALGYPFCGGCGDHHRAPVASDGPCPVDVTARAFEISDAEGGGLVTQEHHARARRDLLRAKETG